MTTDVPDWFAFSDAAVAFGQTKLYGPATITWPADFHIPIPADLPAPLYAVGMSCDTGSPLFTGSLEILGGDSLAHFFNGYPAALVQRRGGPVIAPITSLFDTTLRLIVNNTNLQNFSLWGYSANTPPITPLPYTPPKVVAFDRTSYGVNFQLLPANFNVSAYLLDNLVVIPASVANANADLHDSSGQVYTNLHVANSGNYSVPLGGVVVPSSRTVNVNLQVSAESFVVLTYREAYAPDGSDVV